MNVIMSLGPSRKGGLFKVCAMVVLFSARSHDFRKFRGKQFLSTFLAEPLPRGCIGFVGCIGGAENLLLAKVKNASGRIGMFTFYDPMKQLRS